ncbi:universal stress protein [Methanomicrobium antiquum]|uniref:Universal stress protein n=1 Tax=Methanomicrobium antiquum TaxID=487686 RepID=A0AAF0JM28_9EURY|nr:universal stress protein [Methanomicrobium antiquum]WFN36702.1 universal stress protein [Methanomicrobium antiquum]
MYKKILLATDGSENARRAGRQAAGLAEELSSEIIIGYIFSSPPSQSKMAKANFDVHSILKEDAKNAISETINLFEEKNLTYTLKVAIGEPASEICGIAEKENADLLIIGSRGLGTIKGAVIGSVSHKVAHQAKCPVMIVK